MGGRERGIDGANVRQAMYQRRDWVPTGLDGVCPPATWTDGDHRGFMRVPIYRSGVSGPTNGTLAELFAHGLMTMDRVFEAEIPRKPEWLGW